MQQFTALFKKEINGYFRSHFAYFIFFIYLFISIGGAFYFGEYLAMHDTAVYPLFYLQPLILVILIPALTMRLWSDEYKSGTSEFLLTQPLSNRLPVLAKFFAAGSFAASMSLFLLPFIMYTAGWLKIDVGNVFCCYLGLWLYILLFCALGCFISSLSKYVVISYLLTVFVSGLWLLVRVTKLYDIYSNFLFAEVGISDFAYFIIFAVVLICLNVLVLDYNRSSQKNKNLRFFGGALLFIIGAVALNVAAFLVFDDYKADFTYNRQYTLSPITEEIVSSVKKPITIDVYISKDLRAKNAEYYYYYQQTKRFIKKYQKISASMVSVNITEVEPFSELEKIVLSKNLYYEENLKGTKDYFGAIVRDNDGQGEVIRQFLPQRKDFLEKDIDKALLKLTRKEVIKSIGIYFDPRQELDEFNGFALNIEEDYNVLSVGENTYEISPDLDLLILVNPKEPSKSFLYAVDQYIADGGKVLIFFDLLTRGQSEETNLKNPDTAVVLMDQMDIILGDKLVDDGTVAESYKISDRELNLYKAMTFHTDSDYFSVKPIIESPNGYIGAIISGHYKSAFEQNPHQLKEILDDMMPHTIYGSEIGTVAFIGDADIIENETWIDDSSPDQNPYSAIYKSANMEVVREVIDELAGNDIYNKLPQNSKHTSSFGIGEQINSALYNKYYKEYEGYMEEVKLNRLKLLQKSDGDKDRLQTLLQTDEAGLQLGQAEQKMEKLFYQIRKQYSLKINTIILCCAFIWPAAACLGLWLMVFLTLKRRRKIIGERFNE